MNRYLTTTERAFLRMADRVVMNPVVMARCAGPLDPEQVRVAVRKVQARHPALQVRLVRDARPWFTDHDVGEAEVRVVAREGDAHWRRVVIDELNDPFDPCAGPLVRFVLVQDAERCELICTTDHLNADGRSGLWVLRDVLRAVGDPAIRYVPFPPRAAFDERLPRAPWPRVPTAIQALYAERGRAWANRLGWGPVAVGERPRIGVIERSLEPEFTAALVERCRREGASVQGALMAASTIALATERDPERASPIACITPIDIRGSLEGPVGDDFGIYAWAPTSVHVARRESSVWAHARWAGRMLRHYRRRSTLAAFQHAVDAMAAIQGTAVEDLYGRWLGRWMGGTVVVSNLGRVDLPERVGEVEVSTSGFYAVVPDVHHVLAVQTFRGRMELDFCHAGVAPASVDRVADRVVRLLAEATWTA